MKANRTCYVPPHPALSPGGGEGIEPTPSPSDSLGEGEGRGEGGAFSARTGLKRIMGRGERGRLRQRAECVTLSGGSRPRRTAGDRRRTPSDQAVLERFR